jgi:hypothetical protein
MLYSLVSVLLAVVVVLLVITSWLDARARAYEKALVRQQLEKASSRQRTARFSDDSTVEYYPGIAENSRRTTA